MHLKTLRTLSYKAKVKECGPEMLCNNSGWKHSKTAIVLLKAKTPSCFLAKGSTLVESWSILEKSCAWCSLTTLNTGSDGMVVKGAVEVNVGLEKNCPR